MNRMLLGAFVTLLLVAAGAFWWQGRAETQVGSLPPDPEVTGSSPPTAVPSADVTGLRGLAPPEASEMSREQKRFARYDRNNDSRITRNELMASRTEAFRKLDTDGNNLLTFEEWAVATGNRFKAADANGDLWLSPREFASTKPKPQIKPKCGC